MKKIIKIALLILYNFIAQLSSLSANSGEYKSCYDIRGAYMSAIEEISSITKNIKSVTKTNCKKITTKDNFTINLCGLIAAIKKGDYSHPTLEGYYKGIQGSKKIPDGLASELDKQFTSAGKRVAKWKDPTYFPQLHNNCKNLCEHCDLSQPNTLCSAASTAENKACPGLAIPLNK